MILPAIIPPIPNAYQARKVPADTALTKAIEEGEKAVGGASLTAMAAALGALKSAIISQSKDASPALTVKVIR